MRPPRGRFPTSRPHGCQRASHVSAFPPLLYQGGRRSPNAAGRGTTVRVVPGSPLRGGVDERGHHMKPLKSALAVTAVAALLLTGCAGTGSGTESSGGSKGGTLTILTQ